MKQIEGQILLSIHQYFPTDCIRTAKKNEGMMNLLIENISDKVRKGIMDCDLDSSSLEISSRAKPFFTLTAEEVGFIKDELIPTYLERYEPEGVYQLFRIKPCQNLLTRLKHWQDEIQKQDN